MRVIIAEGSAEEVAALAAAVQEQRQGKNTLCFKDIRGLGEILASTDGIGPATPEKPSS